MRKLVFLYILLSATFGNAQDNEVDQLLNVIPHSPQVSALGRFTDFPTNPYTGQANIKVPIYSLKVGDINVPIDLQYHTSGVRVEDVSSWVGQNWSLNAYGTITRSIHGKPDGAKADYWYLDPPYNFADHTENHYYSGRGSRNSEHDYYYYSAGNYSGKYVIDYENNRKPILIPVQDIDINPSFSINKSVTVTTPDGLVYTYGEVETSKTRSEGINCGGAGPIGEPQVWFLTRITSKMTNAFVEFEYTPMVLKYRTNGIQARHETMTASYQDFDCLTLNEIRTKRLTRIVSSDGQIVEFSANNERKDINGGVTLDEINISRTNSNKVRRFRFKYKYLQRNTFYNLDHFNNVEDSEYGDESLRLFLTDIVQIGENDVPLSPFSFDYSINTGLPDRLSYAQDAWGYYNGKLGNNTLVPRTFFSGKLLQGANRSSNLLSATEGSLREIQFPTGGKRTMTYGLNRCSNCLIGPEIGEILNNNIEQYKLGSTDLFNPMNPSGQTVFEKTFTSFKNGEIIYNITADSDHCNTLPCNIEYKIFQINDDNSIGEVIFDSFQYREQEDRSDFEVKLNYDFRGTYLIRMQINDLQWASQADDFTLIAQIQSPPTIAKNSDGSINGGGLRVEKMNLDDPISGDTIERTYEYGAGYSNGTSFYNRVANVIKSVDIQGNPELGRAFKRTSTPLLPLSKTKGGTVGYEKVTINESGNGKITNYYYAPKGRFLDKIITTGYVESNIFAGTFENDRLIKKGDIEYIDTDDWDYPWALKDDKDWKRGIMYRQEFYDDSNNLIKRVDNSYNFYDDPQDSSYDPQKIKTVKGSRTGIEAVIPGGIGLFAIAFYQLESSWYDLIETKETLYMPDGDSLTTFKSFRYSPNQRTVQKTTEIDSNRDKIEQINLYPTDINSISGSEVLENAHILYKPISQKTLVNDIVASETISEYTDVDGLININTLKQYYKNGTNEVKTDLIYDDFRNIIQVNKEDHSPLCYIWGYNRQYPIAKIVNATYEDIATALGITEVTLKDFNESNLDAINTLRTLLPNAQITTYTYDPLIGMTGQTDPGGYSMTYEYDNFQRLKFIKDQDGKILNENQYHYKNN